MWCILACFYVKIGLVDAGHTLLQEANILNLTLIEWGKQDPDLLPTREYPEDLALYEGD